MSDLYDRTHFVRFTAERDAERDHVAGLCDPRRAFRRRIFDRSCRGLYEKAYVDRHRRLSGSDVVLDQLRTAGIL